MAGYFDLCRSIQRVFNEDAVAHGGVVDQDVGEMSKIPLFKTSRIFGKF